MRRVQVRKHAITYATDTIAGKLRKDREKGQGIVEVYIVMVLVIIFFAYPQLMTQIALMMNCKTIHTMHESFLTADLGISCDTPKYGKWRTIAILFFFAYGVGIPLGGCVVMKYHAGKKGEGLLKKSTNAMLGFLYSGFRLNRYYWEMIIMFRKMLVVFVMVFFASENDKSFRTIFGLWVILGFLLLNVFAKPFMYGSLWVLENVSLGSVALSLNLSMLYGEEYALAGAGEIAVTGLILLINMGTME